MSVNYLFGNCLLRFHTVTSHLEFSLNLIIVRLLLTFDWSIWKSLREVYVLKNVAVMIMMICTFLY